MSKPLRGYRILDLSLLLPGPFLTQTLADLGATVIKVEPPEGDFTRLIPPQVEDGRSAAFVALNHGKECQRFDLKNGDDRARFLSLVPDADVVVESFRPGVMETLGVGFETLCEQRSDIILCSLSGYGQLGPYAKQAGHDINYLAKSGALALCGPADGVPSMPGVQVADLAGGALAAGMGILAALLVRDKNHQPQHLDISMTRNTLGLLSMATAQRQAGGILERGEDALTGGLPCYRAYRTKDDRYMALGALEPKFFIAFCQAAGVPELAAHGWLRGAEGDEVVAALEARFAQKTQAEWVQTFEGMACCCEAVQTPEEALRDPVVGAHVHEEGGVRIPQLDFGF